MNVTTARDRCFPPCSSGGYLRHPEFGAGRARLVHREIDQFLREDLISASTHAAIAQRYPLTRWDWHQLTRWFTIFGGLSTAIGASIFLSEVISLTLETLAVVLVGSPGLPFKPRFDSPPSPFDIGTVIGRMLHHTP